MRENDRRASLGDVSPWCVRTAPHVARLIDRFFRKGDTVTRSDVRRRCEALVDEVLEATGVPQPWSINDWLDRLERVRGRDIDLCAVTWSPGDPTGAWQSRRDHDLIAYPGNTAGFHQDHIILHEIGHMLFEHTGRCALSDEEAHRLAPSLRPSAFAHLFGRATAAEEEYEAEQFAHLMHARVAASAVPRPRRHRTPRNRATVSDMATVARIVATFDRL
ncbi:hypothetical protein [Saccharomonospora cyanea]|uniref:IrrE N-terminal-like domain-containing protein n=1 Tax=Saccharomonospora cyanea NA-134 TaxID=882082 RepID=H5XCZ2_9PSEU|nr:protein of unknown function (DUF955) [Saccharomonospora cyanea NA-134]